jgi:hypothetical protein
VSGLLAALLVLLSACTSHPTAHISLGGPLNTTESAIGNVPRLSPVSFGEVSVCLDRPGSARITGVRLIGSTGMKVTNFAVRPSPFMTPGATMLGADYGTLTAHGFPIGRTVEWVCTGPDTPESSFRAYEFALEVERTGPSAAMTSSYDIEYVSTGHKGSAHVPMSIYLCPGQPSQTAVSCPGLPRAD